MAEPVNSNSNTARRRTWAGSGCMPPGIASLFSEGERAAMSVIAFICSVNDVCDDAIDDISKLAGVSHTTVKRALRVANEDEGRLITIEDRGYWGLTNVVRITNPDWVAWLSGGKWFGPADFRRRWR